MSYETLRGPELSPLAPYYMGHCHPPFFHLIWYHRRHFSRPIQKLKSRSMTTGQPCHIRSSDTITNRIPPPHVWRVEKSTDSEYLIAFTAGCGSQNADLSFLLPMPCCCTLPSLKADPKNQIEIHVGGKPYPYPVSDRETN
jgi:hypothetical protein